MLPNKPPYYGPAGSGAAWSAMMDGIRSGERGWRAYAVQKVVGVTADGIWGSATDDAVRAWQKSHGLLNDGIVGPATQGKMIKLSAAKVDAHYSVMPDGLLDGFARVEGANILAATNPYTPPGGAKGTDCGPCQIRVYQKSDGTYPLDTVDSVYGLKDVFDPYQAFTITARMFTGRITSYKRSSPALSMHTIIEAAVLAHNWPAGAAMIVKYGHVLNADELATWTVIPVDERARYGGRTHYTRGEWAKEYPRRVLLGVSY